MPRFALRLAYDGSGFSGWWRQAGSRTVAGELDSALARLGESEAAVVGAARTDAGVHALGQVAHLDLQRPWTAPELLRALGRHLPGDVYCCAVAAVASDWHACHQALGKTYRYHLDHGPCADPFRTRFAWRPPFQLDCAALQAASLAIPGTRDWSGFSRRGEQRVDLVRTVHAMTWNEDGSDLHCTVSGDGFTYHLVRSLVGAAVAVAHGTCSQADLLRTLDGADTPAGHQQAPAHGLWLEQVHYTSEPIWVTTLAIGASGPSSSVTSGRPGRA